MISPADGRLKKADVHDVYDVRVQKKRTLWKSFPTLTVRTSRALYSIGCPNREGRRNELPQNGDIRFIALTVPCLFFSVSCVCVRSVYLYVLKVG